MDVPGKRKEDYVATKRSDLFCQPCKVEGHQVEADGFCQNCLEYLCNDCCRHHRKLNLTKHHEVLDKQDMPKDRIVAPQVVVCTERCKKHTTELIKFFCKEHDFAGCGDCIIIDHKQCKIDHIQEIAEQFVKGDGYNALMTKIGQLQSKVAEEVKSSEDLVRESDGECSKAISDIKNFRREINAYLDQSEQELIRKCDEKKEEIVSITNKRKDKMRSLESELSNIKEKLEVKRDHVADLFVEAVMIKFQIQPIEKALVQATGRPVLKSEIFYVNSGWRNIINQKIPIGNLAGDMKHADISEKKLADMAPVSVANINIKSRTDKKICRISSMVLTASGHILCTDRINSSVKVVDSRTNQFISELHLSSGPWSIVAIGSTNQFAVTLPDEKKIQFLNFENNLTASSSFSTDGRCYGLAYNENSLIVSFQTPLKVQILTLQGNVKLTLDKVCETNGFCCIGCIAIDIKQSAMFVSDYREHCIVKLKMDGTEIARYSDPELRPRSLIMCADGSLLVCGQGSESVHLVSADCKRIKILLNKDNGAIYPEAICFDHKHNILYISNYNGNIFNKSPEANTIKVLRMI